MVNFLPLKEYMLYCIDQLILRYDLKPPFLDAGCGNGDVSRVLAEKGWHGKAIDVSFVAFEKAQNTLRSFPRVQVERKSLFQEYGMFETILLLDVLEHLKNDQTLLHQISSLLRPGGHVLISVPSNPAEWRWDDDFYGHYRRYTRKEIIKKFIRTGIEPIYFQDFTYPLFWLMRRAYTTIKSPPTWIDGDREKRTELSSAINAWQMPLIDSLMDKLMFLWRSLYEIQFRYFGTDVEKGHEMFVLGRKPSPQFIHPHKRRR